MSSQFGQSSPAANGQASDRGNVFNDCTEVSQRLSYDFYRQFHRLWNMENYERMTLMALLGWLKPQVSIEVGTREGGCTSVLATYSQKVYTLDIDPSCAESVRELPNAELVIGSSADTLPGVIKRITDAGESLEFALIDGDHSELGVRRDIEALLAYKPLRPCYIVMHDSFNPFCRQGMIDTPWSDCPYVHKVDLDFVPGRMFHPDEKWFTLAIGKEMWGGLGLAVLRPEPRVGPVEFLATAGYQHKLLFRHSVHRLVMAAKKYLPAQGLQSVKKVLGPDLSKKIKRLVTGEHVKPSWD
jgi:cephalosporin hydroxylase